MPIRSELESRIITYCSTASPPIPVALENVPFQKPTSGNYVEVKFLSPVTTNPDLAANYERVVGLLQINCCVQQGKGTKAATDLAEAIKALFPVLPKTGTVSIERPPNISSGFPRDDGWWVVPITITYRQ